jgi:hypothetical protein
LPLAISPSRWGCTREETVGIDYVVSTPPPLPRQQRDVAETFLNIHLGFLLSVPPESHLLDLQDFLLISPLLLELLVII